VAFGAARLGVDALEVPLQEPGEGTVDVSPADGDIEDVDGDRVVGASRDKVRDVGEESGPYATPYLDFPLRGNEIAHGGNASQRKRRLGDEQVAPRYRSTRSARSPDISTLSTRPDVG
jgi:hypothetical protein